MSLENARLPAGADRMLGIIKRRGPQRAADLASALGVTGEAARQQLLQLEHAGLVSSVSPKRGVGRPSRVWSLTAAGHARFPDTHAEIIMYCGGGYRSVLTASTAQRMGYRNIYSLIGGYKGLVKANWPMKEMKKSESWFA